MLFDIYGPTRDGGGGDLESHPNLTIFIWMLYVGVYVVLWWTVNAIFGNAAPSLWDFIWQTFLFLCAICGLLGH